MLLDRSRSAMKSLSLDDVELGHDLGLKELAKALKRAVSAEHGSSSLSAEVERRNSELPRIITFPYSRHSSYDELCHLVEVFQPMDVYPCTVDEKNWSEGK